MFMKITVTSGVDPIYPKLMIAESGELVYFVAQDCGICLTVIGDHDTSECASPGTYREDWIMSKFTEYTGSVTLTN
jgi:hypothetical protein